MSYSRNEIFALSRNAAKGAGLSWGMAEDAAHSFCEISMADERYAEEFLKLLILHEKEGYEMLGFVWQSHKILPKVEKISSFILGGYLMDNEGFDAQEDGLWVENLLSPVFLLPYLQRAVTAAKSGFILKDARGETLAAVNAQGVKLYKLISEIPKLSIAYQEEMPEDRQFENARIHMDQQSYQALQSLAERVYAPSSEISRLRGAG